MQKVAQAMIANAQDRELIEETNRWLAMQNAQETYPALMVLVQRLRDALLAHERQRSRTLTPEEAEQRARIQERLKGRPKVPIDPADIGIPHFPSDYEQQRSQ